MACESIVVTSWTTSCIIKPKTNQVETKLKSITQEHNTTMYGGGTVRRSKVTIIITMITIFRNIPVLLASWSSPRSPSVQAVRRALPLLFDMTLLIVCNRDTNYCWASDHDDPVYHTCTGSWPAASVYWPPTVAMSSERPRSLLLHHHSLPFDICRN